MAKSRRVADIGNGMKVAGVVAGVVVLVLLVAGVGVSATRDAPSYESTYVVPEPVEIPRLAVIGDSYSAGTGENTVTWPELFAKKRGWYLNNVAEGGTGYVASDQHFYTRARYALETTPNVILVVGSRNDRLFPRDVVRAEATKLYDVLKSKAPGAQIVVVGPIWDSTAPEPGAFAADAGTREAAQAAGLTYVDALPENWLSDPALIQGDGVHPTDAGMQVLADRIDAAVPQVAPAT